MENSVKIRKLINNISDILEKRSFNDITSMITHVICKMEDRYNLQDDELIKQLELILKSLEG